MYVQYFETSVDTFLIDKRSFLEKVFDETANIQKRLNTLRPAGYKILLYLYFNSISRFLNIFKYSRLPQNVFLE